MIEERTAREIGERVLTVREEIDKACARSGRRPEEVTLIAVTKYVEEERILPAIRAGALHVGENHAQELTQKLSFYEQNHCTVHFIGQLQTNKIKYVCGKADLIHSVDRLPLAEGLQKKARSMGIVQDVLLQVNIGAEAQKGGAAEAEVLRLSEQVAGMPNLRLRGFMCVPPDLGEEGTRPYFASMRELLHTAQEAFPSLKLRELSMGMTGDYRAAVEEGATMVRVGTGIFGHRLMK